MIRAPDETNLRRDAGEVPDEIRDHETPLGIEPHEDPAAMNQQRHLVAFARKRILRRNLPFVAIQQVGATNADGRKDEILDAVEIPDIALRQHSTEYRRHGNPALRIDPVYRIGQEAVHDNRPRSPLAEDGQAATANSTPLAPSNRPVEPEATPGT